MAADDNDGKADWAGTEGRTGVTEPGVAPDWTGVVEVVCQMGPRSRGVFGVYEPTGLGAGLRPTCLLGTADEMLRAGVTLPIGDWVVCVSAIMLRMSTLM